MLICFHFGLSGWHVGKFASRFLVAVASLLPSSLAFAAGLGQISVLSALGQPLRAEIEIVSLQRGEGDSLAARLASGETFRQSSVELNPALLSVKFAVERRSGGQYVMTLTSTQPMNEPFIDMLVELNWPNGRLVREYTFLLDPPEYAGPPKSLPVSAIQGAQVEALPVVAAGGLGTPADPSAPVVVVQAAAAEPGGTAPAQSLPETAQPPQSVPADAPVPEEAGQAVSPEPTVVVDAGPGAEAPSQAGDASSGVSVQVDSAPPAQAPASELIQEPGVSHAYEVKRGDTLSKIVLGNKIEGASLQQMLVAMFRANPDAFVGDNMNRLRTGKILNIPDGDASASVAAADARRIVSAQFADFNEYKRKLGAAVAAGSGPREGSRQVSGQIGSPKADGPTPSKDAAKDQLRLSGADDARRGSKAVAGAATNADDLAAKDNALREANERIALLEKNLQDLQKLSQIRSQAGTQLQQQAAGKQPEPAAKAPQAVELAKTAPAEPAKAPLPAKAEAPKPVQASKVEQPGKTAEPVKAAEAAKTPQMSTVTEAAKVPDAPKAAEASKASPEVPKAAEPAKAEAVAKAPVPAKSGAAKAPAVALPEPSFVDELLDNPVALGGAGGAMLLLAGYAAYAWRKKRSTQFESSVMSVSPSDADSVLGAAGGRNVDTGSSSFQSDFSQSGVAKVDSEEIDPIAEADVYMAYGRDAQAEEILKEALAKDSTRQAIRVKLLEIYANRKDTNAFEKAATDLHAATGGEGPEWAKVSGLGLSIDPTNPLYGGKPGPTAQVFSETAQFAAFRAPEAGPTTEAETPLNIDFDIGATTSGPAAVPDFNLDSGGSSAESAPAGLDFDLGLGTPKLGAGIGEPAPAEPALSETAISIDFDLPMGDKPGQFAAPLPPAAPPSIDFGGIDFNLGSVSGDETTKLESPKAPAVDLASISLDLGASGGGNGSGGVAPDARWQEVATKLDLAKAYEEMGDKDGARELLKEVIKEGDSAQQQKAQTMLQAIG
jgi:pilus assembly protein FimV